MKVINYISDPCRASSLPFWKTETIEIPENMLIVRGDEFDERILAEYDDVPYFKLVHRLKDLTKPRIPDGFELADCPAEAFAQHIRECYGNDISDEEITSYKTRQTFRPELWIAVMDNAAKNIVFENSAENKAAGKAAAADKTTGNTVTAENSAENKTAGKMIASGIAEYDDRISEGALEWIQVSAGYRQTGLGKFIVSELLWRLKASADFVTVSGQMNNTTDPLKLYLSCGFEDLVIWHVLTRKTPL